MLQGATHDLAPASGDLIVMGGRTQADWQHSVPYLGSAAVAPRVSIQWRRARESHLREPAVDDRRGADGNATHGRTMSGTAADT